MDVSNKIGVPTFHPKIVHHFSIETHGGTHGETHGDLGYPHFKKPPASMTDVLVSDGRPRPNIYLELMPLRRAVLRGMHLIYLKLGGRDYLFKVSHIDVSY
jgi:hypothetical protein